MQPILCKRGLNNKDTTNSLQLVKGDLLMPLSRNGRMQITSRWRVTNDRLRADLIKYGINGIFRGDGHHIMVMGGTVGYLVGAAVNPSILMKNWSGDIE